LSSTSGIFGTPSITPDSLDELPAKHSLPWVWFGFVFPAAFFVEEFLHVYLELDQSVAKLTLIAIAIAGWIFWLFCVSRFHTILREISRNHYPTTNAEAVGYHFIPFFNLYWVFKWPTTMSDYVNQRGRVSMVSGSVLGVIMLISLLIGRFFDGGIGMLGVFSVGLYTSAKLRAHLQSISPGVLPPPPDASWFAPAPTSATPEVETDRRPQV